MKPKTLSSFRLAVSLVVTVLIAATSTAQAQTQEAYAVSNDNTLSFYYDAYRASRPGTIHSISSQADVPSWVNLTDGANYTTTKVVFDASFKDYQPTSTSKWFARYAVLSDIQGIENLNTTEVSNMDSMFVGCSRLVNLDLSTFNTAKVTSMNSMFANCKRLKNLNLSTFFTDNVTNMSSMFSGCKSLQKLDLSAFYTDNVTDMNSMFAWCDSLSQLNISAFNTQRVTNMSGMFNGCNALPALDLSHFNTEQVTNMNSMFAWCKALTKLNVTTFNTAQVTDMSSMFSGCEQLSSIDVSSFSTKSVIDMYFMFNYCSALTTIYCNDAWECENSSQMFAWCSKLKGAVPFDDFKIDASMANPETGYFTKINVPYAVSNGNVLTFYYDTQKSSRSGMSYLMPAQGATPAWAGTPYSENTTTTQVEFDASFSDYRPTSTCEWFSFYTALKEMVGLKHLNTSAVTNMSYMFNSCFALAQLDLSTFNTAHVTNMEYMFWSCKELAKLNVSQFNTSAVTNMRGMFGVCRVLKNLDVSSFDTQNVTNMRGMFGSCNSLLSIDVSKFNTQKVTDMGSMFSSCRALNQLNISNFNTQSVKKMPNMFSGCSELCTIYCNDSWTCDKSEKMFEGCIKLVGAVPFNPNRVDATMANPDSGYFTKVAVTGSEAIVINTCHSKPQGIYNVQGVKFNCSYDQLPKGIYIVDGIKVMKQ